MAPKSDATSAMDDEENETYVVSARFTKRLANTFNTEKGTDLTIICGGSRWRVHKSLLCQHSPVFEGMLHGKFMEAGVSELNLPDDNEHGMKMLLKWMYTFNYTPEHAGISFNKRLDVLEVWSGDLRDMHPHMEVVRTADKYDVPELLEIASECFSHDCDDCCGSRDFLEAVAKVYSGEWPDVLRKKVVEVIWLNMGLYYRDHDDIGTALWELAEATPKLLVDVILHGKPVDRS